MSVFSKAIQSLWKDTCTVLIKQSYKVAGVTKYKDKTLYEEIPCRLSYNGAMVASEGSEITQVKQIITLFLAPNVEIPAGAKIVVTHGGRTVTYKQSSEIRVHTNHLEVTLDVDMEA